MAKEAGIDISTIQGSGDQGRIVKKDVEAAMANPDKVNARFNAAKDILKQHHKQHAH